MSTTFRTVEGDTFERISRRAYGDENSAPLIAQANPGVFEPIPIGTIVIAPTRPSDPQDSPSAASGVDEVVLTIGGQRFRYWDGVTIKTAVDSVDTLELTAPFEPSNLAFREIFKPFSYPRVTLSVRGERLFTGTLTTVKPSSSASGVAVAAGAYSLPGVLVDCCVPAGVYASGEGMDFTGQALPTIAKRLLEPFGLEAVFEVDASAPFTDDLAIKPTDTIMPFLAKLAKQRNLVITSDARGRVIFWRSNPGGNPVAKFLPRTAGPVISVSPEFSTQAYYSHITGVEPTSIGLDGGQVTQRNTRLSGVLRPFTFQATDTGGEDLETATRAKIGRMFGDAVSYTIEVMTWRDPKGALWRPNTTVILEEPKAMIYRPYEFLIRDVTFKRTAQGATAELALVIPAAYRGDVPEVMPWD